MWLCFWKCISHVLISAPPVSQCIICFRINQLFLLILASCHPRPLLVPNALFDCGVCHYNTIICSLQGLSPDLQSMEQIRRIMRPTDVPDTGLFSIVSDYITKLKDDKMLISGNVFDQNTVFSMLSFCDRLLDATVHINDCSMFFVVVSLFFSQACYVTCCGQTQTKMFRAGERMIGEFPSPLGPMSSANFSTVMTWTSSAEHIR